MPRLSGKWLLPSEFEPASVSSCEVIFLEGKRTSDKEVKSVALRTLGLEPGQGLDACYSKLIFISILVCT